MNNMKTITFEQVVQLIEKADVIKEGGLQFTKDVCNSSDDSILLTAEEDGLGYEIYLCDDFEYKAEHNNLHVKGMPHNDSTLELFNLTPYVI